MIIILFLLMLGIIVNQQWKLYKLRLQISKFSTSIEKHCTEILEYHTKLSQIPHHYEQEIDAGIGFCKICYSDNMNDGNHILEK